MQTLKILAIMALVGGLILAACTAIPPASPTLDGTSWILETLNGQPARTDTVATLNLDKGAASGTDGCNRYSTSYTVNGSNFAADKQVISTMMACPDPILQQASDYIAALTGATTFKNDGKRLALSDASGKTLVTFTAQSNQLGGTSWLVTGYNTGKQAVISVMAETKLTANFGTDGRLSGTAGCNDYTATYETSGQKIKIGPAAATRKMCAEPSGAMEQEAQYLQALQTAATCRVEGNQLELRTADGALAASFQKLP